MAKGELVQAVDLLTQRIDQLEHQAELLKTVLIVKEPGAAVSASAFEGLRKQIIASANERLTHLNQIVQMRVALDRAESLDDLKPLVASWEAQNGIVEVSEPGPDQPVSDLFDAIDGGPLDGGYQVVEPAYVDSGSGRVLRTGRALQRPGPAVAAPNGSVSDLAVAQADRPTTEDDPSPTKDSSPASADDSSPTEED